MCLYCCATQQVVTETGTDYNFENSYDGCQLVEGGYISAFWKYTSVIIYECNTATHKEYVMELKIYTSWVTNVVYKSAISSLLDAKNQADEFIIPRNERDALWGLIDSYSDTLYSGNEIKIKNANGITNLEFNGVEKGTTTIPTIASLKNLFHGFGGYYIKTLSGTTA
jgi:hypothetical protein